MQARAEAKFIRMAPRKVRLLVNLIRGMRVTDAQYQLKMSTKAAATPVLKALNSAIANAQHNVGADTSNFRVLTAFVDEGPKLKRYMPRAQGRATLIRKRSSHITIVVGEKVEAKKAAAKAEAVEAPAKVAKPAAKKATARTTSKKTK